MTTIFIGGSRAVSKLNSPLREKLDDFVARRCKILIGDANGADKAVQQHLRDRAYGNVLVYCMDHCRNNLGDWPVKHVTAPGTQRNFAYYAAKDAAMAHDSNCGVMLWDGKSKGTLNNIQNLIGMGKKTLVYLAPEKAFHKLASKLDLDELLLRCNGSNVQRAQQQIQASLS